MGKPDTQAGDREYRERLMAPGASPARPPQEAAPRPLLHHADGGWHGARLFHGQVDSTPRRLARDSVSPSLMPEADAAFVAKA